MKRILFLISLGLMASQLMLARGSYCPQEMTEQTTPRAKSMTGDSYRDAINQADQLIMQLSATINKQELDDLAKYFEYYKSWGGYQAVTPAPRELVASLNPQAKAFAQKIKELADTHFTRKRPAGAGASSLTKKGEKFFTHVHRQLVKAAQKGA